MASRTATIKQCPTCERYSLDWDGIRALQCFNGHPTADYREVATLEGPAAEVAIALRHIHNLTEDEEHQGEVLAEGAESVLAAIGGLSHDALTALTATQSKEGRDD
jgi:hypothetical protein